jgi:hypothetical protein
LAPLQNEAIAIHNRLLARDPTASDDLAGAYLEPLVVWLRETDRRAPEDTRVEAAEDAILALIRRPESYSPGRQTLEVYLRMSARGDLRNALAKERRRKKDRVLGDGVEVLPDGGKYLGREEDPALPLYLAEEKQSRASDIPESLRRKLSAADLRATELILEEEHRTSVFAELFGLLDLALREQFREVKRRKDRLKKMLARARRKP